MTVTRNSRRSLQGTVISDACDKTVIVRVERTYRHPKYGKFVRRHKKYMAHDEEGVAERGNVVEIVSCRPMSKRKRWRVGRVVVGTEYVESVPAAELDSAAASDEASEAADTGGDA